MTENQQARKKLQKELRNLFQFDVSDLDFGIYRILNRKKDQIKQFIEKDLLDAVEKGLEAYQAGDRKKFEEQLEKSKNKIPPQAFDEHGKIKEDFEGFEDVKKYQEAEKALKNLSVSEDTEKKIYNDLFTFFSRYYSDGDFVTKRRISTRDFKYAVPYNGEEVLLHWANKDQYYIKTGEQFTSFKFELEGSKKSVWFKVAQAETDKDNVKEEEDRSFVLRPDDTIEVEGDELTIWFEYRPLSDEEMVKWRDIHNKVENKNLKGVDREKLCIAYDDWIRNELEDEWKNPLSEIPKDKTRSLLFYRLNHYTGKNKTDYFIHKDLKSFFERELEYYLKNEVIRVDDFIEDQSQQAMEVALTRAKVVRQIGKKIIAFLSQIENFQKKLFEKRKFVVDTHYCFTLDMVPKELYDEILENQEQLQSWVELYAMEKWDGDLEWDGNWTKAFLEDHPYMMVDTQFFNDENFRYTLIESINSLDDSLTGLLTKGDNYQINNLLNSKFKQQVKSIYLDPPYNTEKDRETGKFIYKDGFARSTWLSFINDRIKVAKNLLSEQGTFFCSIDDNENYRLREILDNVFNQDNYLYELVWNLGTGTKAGHFTRSHEYIEAYAKNKKALPNFSIEDGGLIRHGALKKISKANPASQITFPAGIEFEGEDAVFEGDIGGSEKQTIISEKMIFEDGVLKEPVTIEAGWAMKNQTLSWIDGKETFDSKGQKVNKFYFNSSGILWYEKERTKVNPSTVISKKGNTKKGSSELNKLFAKSVFDYPKPTDIVSNIVQLSADNDGDIFMDFFAGSGPLAHAILELNKSNSQNHTYKYLLSEMGSHFSDVLLKRIKKVVFSLKWESGIPQDIDGQSHAFKYHFIESYEDALNNIDFKNLDDNQEEFEFEDYKLHYMLDFETQGVSASLLKDGAFDTPFDYKLKIQRGHEPPAEETVDLVETFHYLIGLWVQKLRRLEHQNRKYIISIGQIRDEDAVEVVCIIWRNTKDLDLDEEAGWIQEEIIKDQTFDRIYINGVNKVKDAEPIEITLREKMFEDVV